MNTKQLHYLEKGYGVFPYFIIRIESGIYMQVPIHFNCSSNAEEGVLLKLPPEASIEEIEISCIKGVNELLHGGLAISDQCYPKLKFLSVKDFDGCVVLNPSTAYYLDNARQITAGSPPRGGTLITMSSNSITFPNRNHYVLQ